MSLFLRRAALRNGVAPVISLDAKKYKLVQQLDAAMTSGTPSLIGCDRLTVSGDVQMAGNTVFKVIIPTSSGNLLCTS